MHGEGHNRPALHFDEYVVQPLIPQSVGDVELKRHKGLEHVLDAANPENMLT